jgi:hypothetical protein
LAVITNIRLAAIDDDKVMVENKAVETGLSHDVIALARSLIHMVCFQTLTITFSKFF